MGNYTARVKCFGDAETSFQQFSASIPIVPIDLLSEESTISEALAFVPTIATSAIGNERRGIECSDVVSSNSVVS
jgi:hypothetical protein